MSKTDRWPLLAFWVMVWSFGAIVGRTTAPPPPGTFAQQVLLERINGSKCDCGRHEQLLEQIVELEKLRLEKEPAKRW